MNPEDITTRQEADTEMTHAVGQIIGELLVVIRQVVGALRDQPGFDNDAFDDALRDAAVKPEVSLLQQHALQMLLEQRPR